jgi:hypothetical protein
MMGRRKGEQGQLASCLSGCGLVLSRRAPILNNRDRCP